MKVLLLRPRPESYAFSPAPPLGLGYLATALINHGFETKILDLNNRLNRKRDIVNQIKNYDPDLVGVQVYSRDLQESRDLLGRLRSCLKPAVPIVVGGPHPSTMPDQLFDHLDAADYGLMGEAELTLPLLARHLSENPGCLPEAIPGLVYRLDHTVRVNPATPPENLDALDFPAWDAMRLKGYPHTEIFGGGFYKRAPAMTMLTSRGCPFHCTFCGARRLYGDRVRYRNPERVVDEMEILGNKYGFQELKIIDDNFNATRQHVLEIGEAFARRPVDVSMSFACGLHLRTLDDEVLRTIKLLGGYELMVAIESGSQRVLNLMKKQVDLSEVREKVALIRRHGFKVIFLFILGYPGETPEEIEQSIRLALDLPLDRAHFNCFSPFPGSEIYSQLLEQGRLKNFAARHVHFETMQYSFVDGLDARQLNRIRQKALLRFYLRPRSFFSLLVSFRKWPNLKFLLVKAAEYFRFSRR